MRSEIKRGQEGNSEPERTRAPKNASPEPGVHLAGAARRRLVRAQPDPV